MCNHGQNLRVFETWSEGVTLNSADQYLIVNPYFHSFGYKAGWLAALIRGATVHPVPVFDLDEVLNLIQSEAISFLPGAPTIFQSILTHPNRDEYDLSSLRCAVTGAASIPVQLVRDMKSVLGFDEVYTAYGLTESTGVVSLCRSGDDFETIATTSGQPMDGIEVQTTGPDGKPTAPGQPGEIWVRGFNVMQGYLDDPHATNETITPEGWLKTGDIGEFTDSGYLRITDRITDMYICGGFNCYPAEIENVLLNHVAILDVSVVGGPDERLGEVGHAYIIAKPGEEQDEEELITWARDNLANFKVPRRITFVNELPRNASGKVQKFLLKNK
jgi:acyl-CoA synthetase (AMP-forming)/AMP-acid ligase II